MTDKRPIDSTVAASVAKLLSPTSVLVGGQALGVWIGYFKLEAELEVPVTSEDVDFVASQDDALLIARELKGQVRLAQPFDHSPNLATVEVPRDGDSHLEIDILKCVFGVENEDLRREARGVEIQGTTFLVMHPVHVLESRIANTLQLQGRYESPRGLAQLKAAVMCTHEYLRAVSMADMAVALEWARRVANWAHDNAKGDLAWRRHKIDLLDAVPLEALSFDFRNREWPYLLARVEKKRRGAKKTEILDPG